MPDQRRHESLVVFSHEHHHGLVFCSRLKQGHKADDETLRKFVKDFWNNHLELHFTEEENLILPVMPEGHVRQQFLEEHASIRQLIKLINDRSKIKKQAAELARILNDHIRFEERVMFPWLEKVVSPNELKRIGAALKDKSITPHSFENEFWKKNDV